MPRTGSRLPVPSKTDLEILAVLCDRPPATGREIYDAFLATGRLRHRIAYTTIKTYLDRLVQKDYVHGHTLGNGRGTYLYTAVVSREAVRDHPDLLARLVHVFRSWPAFNRPDRAVRAAALVWETPLRSVSTSMRRPSRACRPFTPAGCLHKPVGDRDSQQTLTRGLGAQA
jgi:predicted transcriptional regulator